MMLGRRPWGEKPRLNPDWSRKGGGLQRERGQDTGGFERQGTSPDLGTWRGQGKKDSRKWARTMGPSRIDHLRKKLI